MAVIPVLGVSQNLKSGGTLKPEQAVMDIRHYTITLDIDPQQKYIKGNTEIDLILSQSTQTLLFDLWHNYKVNQVMVNGKIHPFNLEKMTSSESPQHWGRKSKVKIDYEGTPALPSGRPGQVDFNGRKTVRAIPGLR